MAHRDQSRQDAVSTVPVGRLDKPGRPPTSPLAGRQARVTTCVLVAASTWLFVGGVSGLVVAAVSAMGAWFSLDRVTPRARVRDQERILGTLPLAADLLSEALAAGCPPARAVEVTARAVGGPLGQALQDGAAAAAVGTDPATAWAGLYAEPAARPLVRALAAAMTRGRAPSAVLHRVACDARDALRWAGEAKARSLGARAAAPLGLCFLPAFVLLGVVPIVATNGLLLP